jgi:glutathione S-transferase
VNAPLRLITIGFSHYCEKARWAVDRTALEYREDDHVPIFHWRATLGSGAKRTVPALVMPGRVLKESNDILRFADEQLAPERRLFPEDAATRAEVEALVADFDRGLGPAMRRWLYFHVLPDRGVALELLTSTGPGWERSLVRGVFPVMRAMMRRGLKVNAAGAARSWQRVAATFDAVDARLADGRRYLAGDRFSAADLTFAALAGVLVQPMEQGFRVPESAQRIPAIATENAALRARPCGRFIARIYAEERPPARGGLQR